MDMNVMKMDSLSDVNTSHASEFLETLHLKSKDKTLQDDSMLFNPRRFLTTDIHNDEMLCKIEEHEDNIDNGNFNSMRDLQTNSTECSQHNLTDGQNSLGKTLAFSLQLIAAGDGNIMPQLSRPCQAQDSSEKDPYSLRKQKNDDVNNMEDQHLTPHGHDTEETSCRGRYKTRSSMSCVESHNVFDGGDEPRKNVETETICTNTVNDNDKHIIIESDSQSQDGANKMAQENINFTPQPKKRGRRKKEDPGSSDDKENSYLCSQCGKGFNKSQTLRQHFITHTDRFACSFCNVRCKSKGDLRSHTQTHTKEKPFRCEVCNTFYTRESILKKHKLTQLHKNACFQLGNQIQMALNAGMKKSNSKAKKKYKFHCQFCSKTFATRQKLRQHTKIHNYRFACSHCNKRCKTLQMLNIHQKCHAANNSLPCKFCSRLFSNLSLLREHIRMAHSFLYWRQKFPGNLWKTLLAEKVENIVDLRSELSRTIKSNEHMNCKICSKQFRSKKAFEKHCAKHGEMFNLSNEKNIAEQSTSKKLPNYQCSVCSKTYILFEEFSKHHADLHCDKPMTCHICYNQFDNTSEFKSHVQNHGPTMLFSGASLEESKVQYMPRRSKRNSSYQPVENTNIYDENPLQCNSKVTRQAEGELDDNHFLESSEFVNFLSSVFIDSNEDPIDDEDDENEDDEELYSSIKFLLLDGEQDSAASSRKTSSDKQDKSALKKLEINMKMFSVEDDENNFYKCTPCNSLFITSVSLREHMKAHICLYCDIFCQNKNDLSDHFHCQEKQSKLESLKNDIEKNDLDELSEMQSEDAAFSSDDEMNEVFYDELEGILDYENKAKPSVDFLSIISHDEIIKTNKKIFERYSCIDVPTNIYACIICKRKYARPTTLTRHFKTHVCHYCNTFFVDKSDLNDHKYKHRKKAAMIKAEISGESNSKLLRSPLVSKTNRELFKKFTIIDASRNVNKCCLCDKLFVRKTVLTRHMKTHVCSYCDKFFEDKYELARHTSLHKMDSHIPDEESVHRQFPVFDQEKPFVDNTPFPTQLEDENKMVSIGSSFSSSMPQFTTSFSTPSSNAHETVTFIQIPVSEALADPNAVTFGPGVTADAPTYQILTDPIVPPQASFVVTPPSLHGEDANKILTLTQDQLVSGNSLPVETTDIFECNICSKTFFKSGHLKSHITTHAAPAPFACRYCGKTFVRNGHLRKHEKTHDVKRCESCDMSFTCQFELDHHMQIHQSYTFYK